MEQPFFANLGLEYRIVGLSFSRARFFVGPQVKASNGKYEIDMKFYSGEGILLLNKTG
ncbi:hypothetical protein QF042_003802 [Pedobacter sp. W3I1]|nr:hypothetical protein [Pedobacter sp. W3I1]